MTRIIRFTIGLDLHLEPTRGRHRLWKLFDYFPDELSARIYIEQSFWPNGPVCPRCKSGEHVGSGADPFRCNACDRQFTVLVGTIFEHSHIPLLHWLWAIIILAQSRRRVSSTKLAELLGISQPAALAMICKLRPRWDDLREDFPVLFDEEYLDFVDFGIVRNWPFYSERPRRLKKDDPALTSDANVPTSEETLVSMSADQWESLIAERKAIEKARKAEEWARKVKRGGKRMKAYLASLARRKAKTDLHKQDHLKRIPFEWLPQRDCPACKFGEPEWQHWEAVVVQFDFVLWEEFWEWIEDLNRQFRHMLEDEELEDEYGPIGPIVPIDWVACQREYDERKAAITRKLEACDPDVEL